MARRIDADKQRYMDIVRGKTRDEVKKLIKKGGIFGKRDGKVIHVPIPIADLPRIRYGSGDSGVGSGEGEEGEIIGREGEGDPSGKAGDQPGEFMYEEYTIEQLVDILSQEIELPNIKPKGRRNILVPSDKLKTINHVGPPGRRHMKRTLKNAMKRQMASGNYRPGQLLVPVRPDRRYRSFKNELVPDMNAVIFYMMDVSGSMGDEQKEIVRTQNFWIDVLLANQYPGLESRYITHHAAAREVTRDDFYHTRESGGTMISSALDLCARIFHDEYGAEDWNAYAFYSSDGDNWDNNDTRMCFDILDNGILPFFNLFAYTQVHSEWGSGQFIDDLHEYYDDIIDSPDFNMVTSKIEGMDDILESIEALFKKGK